MRVSEVGGEACTNKERRWCGQRSEGSVAARAMECTCKLASSAISPLQPDNSLPAQAISGDQSYRVVPPLCGKRQKEAVGPRRRSTEEGAGWCAAAERWSARGAMWERPRRPASQKLTQSGHLSGPVNRHLLYRSARPVAASL